MRVAARTGEVAALDALFAAHEPADRFAWGESLLRVLEGAAGEEVRTGAGNFVRIRLDGERLGIGVGESASLRFGVPDAGRSHPTMILPLSGEGTLVAQLPPELHPGRAPLREELGVSRSGAQAWLEAHGHVGPRSNIRRRPAMYLGSRGAGGLREAFEHLLERVFEERRRGDSSRLDVVLHDEDRLTVEDDGAGDLLALLPGEAPGDARPIPASYDWRPGDPDPLGVNAVRAVCERFETDAVVGPRRLVVIHERGLCVGRSEQPLSGRRGARFQLRIDRGVLDYGFDARWLRDRLDEVALLLPGLRVTFTDVRDPGRALDVVRPEGLGDLRVAIGVPGLLELPLQGRRSVETKEGRWTAEVSLQLAASVKDLAPTRAALEARVDSLPDHWAPAPAASGVRLTFANDRQASPDGAIERGLAAGLAACEGWGGRGLRARLAIAVAVRGPIQFGDATRWVVASPEVEPLVRDALKDAIETATRERPEQVARALRPQTGS